MIVSYLLQAVKLALYWHIYWFLVFEKTFVTKAFIGYLKLGTSYLKGSVRDFWALCFLVIRGWILNECLSAQCQGKARVVSDVSKPKEFMFKLLTLICQCMACFCWFTLAALCVLNLLGLRSEKLISLFAYFNMFSTLVILVDKNSSFKRKSVDRT